jgi:hypothetical protein
VATWIEVSQRFAEGVDQKIKQMLIHRYCRPQDRRKRSCPG